MKTRTFITAGLAAHARTITTTRHLIFRRACLWTGFLLLATIALGPQPAQAAVTEAWVQRYQGDGLAIMPIPAGARLRCVFQRLEGEATREGLWLSSTVTNAVNERFRVVAAAVGRVGEAFGVPASAGGASESFQRFGLAAVEPAKAGTPNHLLPRTGTVEVAGKLARFVRPGLTEEYSASMDGVRQDFIIEQRPVGAGPLRVELAVTGAKLELLADGARLVLDGSGRKLNYNRLRVTDATGKELSARMEVVGGACPSYPVSGGGGESQRDSVVQPRVASLRATLRQAKRERTTLKGLHHDAHSRRDLQGDTTPLGLEIISCSTPRVAAERANPGLDDAIPSGLNEIGAELTGGTLDREVFDEGVEHDTRGACAPMLAVVVNDAEAVYPVRIDPTFSDANWISMGGVLGAKGEVKAAVVDGSGNLYIGGQFTVVGDVFATNIAKWNGSSWSALGSGVRGSDPMEVNALAVSGSDLYAGGRFTTAGGGGATNIAKWDGSSWTALGSGMDSYVYALAVSGSDLYAGGFFRTAGGSAASGIAKWDGTSWTALGSGMDEAVYALAVSGSNVYAGGYFTTAGGSAASGIAKWDGSGWSPLGSGLGILPGYSSPSVSALAVSGSDLYAGGYFTTAAGNAATNIAKWDGSSWSALGSWINGGVFALAVSGSNLYAAAGGGYIAKWNGSSWSALGSGMGGGPNGFTAVIALAVSGSNLYAGGRFTTAGGSAANFIAKWDGSSWSALGSGMDDVVYALAMSGSNLYAGGRFTTAGGSAANFITKWDGSSWSALGSEMSGGSYGTYVSVLAVSGSNVYAGGGFTTAGGSAANFIAKWDGSSWTALGSGMGGDVNGEGVSVNALAVSGSDLYAGGVFSTAGGNPANYIAKWDGSGWSALGSGMGGVYPIVGALAVSGSNVYAGGYFPTAGGSAANHIAKWNGSSWSALGSGMNEYVSALAVSGSNVYAGGGFTTAGGSAANHIAKWNGSSWSAVGSGMNYSVYALAVSGGDLYAGGDFTTAGGSAANHIAKWDGSSWSALGSGIGGVDFVSVSALAVSGSDLYAGGNFTTAGGKVSPYIARAYLVTMPTLSVLRSGVPPGGIMVSWPSADTASFTLEHAGTLAPPPSWVTNAASITDDGTNKSVTLPATNSAQFFRLRRP